MYFHLNKILSSSSTGVFSTLMYWCTSVSMLLPLQHIQWSVNNYTLVMGFPMCTTNVKCSTLGRKISTSSAQRARFIQAQWLLSSRSPCLLHTPLTLRHLGRVSHCLASHILDTDTKQMKTPRRRKVQIWKGLMAEVWIYWSVKLPWQPCCCFSISWRAAQLAPQLACSVPSSLRFLFICFSVHTNLCWVLPSLCRGWNLYRIY